MTPDPGFPIQPGHRATFTVLADDPYEREPHEIASIPVLGTVYEGRWFPAPAAAGPAASVAGTVGGGVWALAGCGDDHGTGTHRGCTCRAARALAAAWAQRAAAAGETAA